jgi:t-SNARE complex subunit (syntaxin)
MSTTPADDPDAGEAQRTLDEYVDDDGTAPDTARLDRIERDLAVLIDLTERLCFNQSAVVDRIDTDAESGDGHVSDGKTTIRGYQ